MKDKETDDNGAVPRSDLVVCVHGLGYVGLPTAAILANSGYKVRGFDVNPELRTELRSGEISLDEQDLARFVERALEDGLTVVDEVKPADFHLICVPTPYNKDLDTTNLSYVEEAAETVANMLREGDTVVLESTVPPGTTAEKLREILERSGLSAENDFLLGYSPETVLPGNTLTELRENDRLVGTVAGRPHNKIVSLYDSFVSGDLRTTDATTAEFVKLIQNAYRDVNIAFANEVAKLAHEFDIVSRDSISLANNHRRVDILRPGPGVGGHCIPIDPLFLKHGNDVPMLIETARRVNDEMVGFVTGLLTEALGDLGGKKIALLGVAYKGGVGDTRMSPALSLTDTLRSKGAEVRLTDPYVDVDDIEEKSLSLEEAVEDTDATVLVTDHPEYGALDPNLFVKLMRGNIVVDTRDMIDTERWGDSGFEVHSI
jgi:UDP-N-acetyl-D-mannosaminuronic acid dehydrogenase